MTAAGRYEAQAQMLASDCGNLQSMAAALRSLAAELQDPCRTRSTVCSALSRARGSLTDLEDCTGRLRNHLYVLDSFGAGM